MRGKLKILVLFSLSVLLLIGCSQNKRGTWGPAWDLPITLPLIDSRTKTVDELLDEREGIEILDSGIYALKDDMGDMDFEELDVGELLDEVNIDDLDIYEEIELPIIDFNLGELNIAGFQLDEEDEVSQTISEKITIDLGDDLDGGIEKVVFSKGKLSLGLEDLPEGWDYEITSFKFASITSQGQSSVNLKGEVIDLTKDLEVQIEVKIFSTGSLTYNSGEKVGIRVTLTDLEVESVLIDINSFEGDDLAGEVESTNLIESFDDIDGDIREELAKIDFLDAQISLAFKGIEGIDVNLEELYIAALDREIEDGQEVIDDYLLDSDNARISLGSISGGGDEIDLVGLGLLDMIKNPEAKSIVLYGNYQIEGDKVQIGRETKIGITQVIVEIPLSIRITDDISVSYEAEKIDVSEKTKEDIERNLFESARLKVKGLKNDFNIGAKVELYLGVFEGEFNEEDFYSNSDNIIETATIKANYEGDLEFVLRDSDIRKFLEDDLYFGVKGTIFKTDELSIKSGDEISLGEAYSVIVFKVNQ